MDERLVKLCLAALAITAAFFILKKPISQDEDYHDFADTKKIWGIPNGMDVLSNIAFVLPGFSGLLFIGTVTLKEGNLENYAPYIVFFAGLFLTGFGSAWYHLKPDNKTLVWDRIPMTIAFAGFFCSVLSEQAGTYAGNVTLIPLLVAGIASVLYWSWGESKGSGDLRPYGLVQFLPMILVPLILFMYGASADYWPYIATLLGFYALAKVFESLDDLIYSKGNLVSGHTLKHIAAGFGTFSILFMVYGRIG